MTCERVHGPGFVAIVCSRGSRPRKRCACGDVATLLCDYPLRGRKVGKTCDAAICPRCSVNVGEDRDYCMPHSRVEERSVDGAKAESIAPAPKQGELDL